MRARVQPAGSRTAPVASRAEPCPPCAIDDNGAALHVPGGEARDDPSVGRRERVPVDVPPELLPFGVLPSLVPQGDLPLGMTQVRTSHHAPPAVVRRNLDAGLRQVTRQQPVTDPALRWRRRPGGEMRRPLTGAGDSAHPVRARQSPFECRRVQPAPARQGVAQGEQVGRVQRGAHAQERLRSRRDPEAADVDHVLVDDSSGVDQHFRPLWDHPAGAEPREIWTPSSRIWARVTPRFRASVQVQELPRWMPSIGAR